MTEDAQEVARQQARARVRQMKLDRAEQLAHQGPPQWKVQRKDLRSLESVKTLLVALNDAYIGAGNVLRLVECIPVLRARCVRRALVEAEEGQELSSISLEAALRQIGNVGLESELLTVLEDLTMLQAEQAE